MVVAQAPQRLKEAEITEQDSLLLTRNLLRIAIFNISYIRGLFPDKYFNDKSVPALEMKIKKLMPLDAESRRLIDWMEKGVYDALQKKYLKTLLFCICETVEGPMIEEYAFSFSYPDTGDNDVIMNVSERGSKKQPATFKSNSTEITPDQMRSSACKMIRTLVQLMRTLDRMPEERTILMKLFYYDDVTPEDYEPPFFRCCTEVEAGNIWRKNPLKMDVGEVNSKHLVLALKVKSVLDPCEDENDGLQDGVSLDGSASDNSSFDTEVQPGHANQYVMAPVGEKHKRPDDDMVDDDDTQTQDSEQEEENSARIREWIRARHSDTFDLSDILTNFPDISMQLSEEIVATLMDEGLISKAGKGYTINREKDCNPDVAAVKDELQKLDISPRIKSGDLLYMKALSYALPMDYVTITKLQSKLGDVNQTAVRKLIDKMLEDGFVKGGSRRLGKRVVHNDLTKKKLFEVRKALESEFAATRSDDHMFKPNGANFTANARDLKEGSTYAGLHSIGSDLTRTREHSPIYPNGSARTGQTPRSKPQDGCNTPTSRAAAPIASIESGVNKDGNANGHLKADGVSENSSQNKRSRKTSTVREPILQYLKRLKSQAVNDTLEG